MRILKRTFQVVALIGLIVCLVVVWVYTAAARGRLMARFDTHRGHYVVLAYGLPLPERSEYAELLRERYGIEVRTVAFCIVSKSLCDYADGYNGVSIPAANREFGHDIFKECWEIASRNWKIRKAAILEED
jgi:hypothetical protein